MDEATDNIVERIWRCSCGGPHFVQVTRHEWEDGGAYFAIEDYCGPTGWRERLRQAWQALWGRPHGWSELILTPQMAREIAEELVYAAIWLERKEAESRANGQAVSGNALRRIR